MSFIRASSPWAAVSLLVSWFSVSQGCTDLLVTPGASVDGSAILSYNADSPTLYGSLYHYPALSSKSKPAMRKVYDWDSGVYLGEIAEWNQTSYNVVGNSNEHGLVIGESTFGGVAVLAYNQTGAKVDYGSLIYLTLQRAKTVHEAINVMVDLMDTYGYYSGGESFSLFDPKGDAWMMEVIGRGSDFQGGKLGAVWVAMKIPDGMVAAHANQARITTFPRDDPETCRYAEDVVDVAVHYGLYPADADPLDFSFSDVYHPLSFIGARQGEARVWSLFSKIADPTGAFLEKYQSYAMGESLGNRMPLYIQPYQKLSVLDVMELMNSHYEDTVLDSSIDVGAGLFESPYRPRPLVWSLEKEKYNGLKQQEKTSSVKTDTVKYHNERSIATPKTGWNFVAQVRPWMPGPLAALVWFAADDSSTSPRTPVYGGMTRLPSAYYGRGSQDGVLTPILEFDTTKAFWVQNMVSNFCYFRYKDVYPALRAKIDELQKDLLVKTAVADQRAMDLYMNNGTDAAIEYLNLFGVNAGQALHKAWLEFYGFLFVRYRDFYTIEEVKDEPVCGCRANEPGMSEAVKKRIVQETGDHYKVVDSAPAPQPDGYRESVSSHLRWADNDEGNQGAEQQQQQTKVKVLFGEQERNVAMSE